MFIIIMHRVVKISSQRLLVGGVFHMHRFGPTSGLYVIPSSVSSDLKRLTRDKMFTNSKIVNSQFNFSFEFELTTQTKVYV